MVETIKVTLVKSMIGRPEKHRRVLRGLGLNRIGQAKILPNTQSIRGMVNKVSSLLKVEENENESS
ncbi:MAG: 50S ribosomal protein L30 [Desulfobacterales bacterium]|nr:50S ribosomal protein L30 [Desulfobacterales bacterium]